MIRVVIDMQGIQKYVVSEESYSFELEFIKALVRSRKENEVYLSLDSSSQKSVSLIRDAFRGVLPQENIRVWHAPTQEFKDETGYEKWYRISECMHESFLHSLKPDVIYISGCSVGEKSGLATRIGDLSIPASVSVLKGGCKSSSGIDNINHKNEDCVTATVDKIGDTSVIYLAFEEGKKLYLDNSNKGDVAYSFTYVWDVFHKQIVSKVSSHSIKMERGRPRLAFVSPLPPERSGIADYSNELIPCLSEFYDIDVVTDQDKVGPSWVKDVCKIIKPEAFSEIAADYDCILYHFGNNPMHARMFEMLEKHPGVVVLHDFYVSGVQWYRETQLGIENALWKELYLAHGYTAIKKRFYESDQVATLQYPTNFSIFKNALGVIVHSEHSARLAKDWYVNPCDVSVIPLLRHPAENLSKQEARRKLGIGDSVFLVCSFGFLGKTKQNHRLLDAWEKSFLSKPSKECKLVFVGAEDDSLYTNELSSRLKKYKDTNSAVITGWTSSEEYRLYLAASDVAVQLRTLSRGETSAAVLDCLNYGVATIINSNGAMADFTSDVVYKLDDDFSDVDLTNALEFLESNKEERLALASRGKKYIRTKHAPDQCAKQYSESILNFYKRSYRDDDFIERLSKIVSEDVTDCKLIELSKRASLTIPENKAQKTLYIDVSVVARDDFRTGIQRAVRALTLALIDTPPEKFRVEPVYLSDDGGEWHYVYAHEYTLSLMGVTGGWLKDAPVDFQPGDILLGLDLSGSYVIRADNDGLYDFLKMQGVHVSFVIYDLIPIQFGNAYPEGFKEGHEELLQVVAKTNSAICISQTVAKEFSQWVRKNVPCRNQDLNITWFHLGADLHTSSPTYGLENSASEVIEKINRAPTFLMVGTIEPRKGHKLVLDAFDLLWGSGVEANLVIVGKKGWMVDKFTDRLSAHKEKGVHLFWLEGISDEYLEKIYSDASCLIAASKGEGFGLPLIEAAQKGLPIIARDLPVFREVAGENAYYFSEDGNGLADDIQYWIELYYKNEFVRSDGIKWLTWSESAEQLKRSLGI